MKCKNCEGNNVVEGIAFGNHELIHNVGPKYKGFLLTAFAEQTFCDLCEDCGEIQRLYVKPGTKRNWIKSLNSREDLLDQKNHKEFSEKEKEVINKEIKMYEELILSKLVNKEFVENLNKYEKHELYDYPVQTKGPSYRLYKEKATGIVVMIKPATMNLHKGNYVVCIPIQTKDYETYNY